MYCEYRGKPVMEWVLVLPSEWERSVWWCWERGRKRTWRTPRGSSPAPGLCRPSSSWWPLRLSWPSRRGTMPVFCPPASSAWIKLVENCLYFAKKNCLRTVKPSCNDHPWDSKIVAVVDRWSLFRGQLFNNRTYWIQKYGGLYV